MNFVLLRAEYDHHTKRAYVEFRAPDDDGGEAITTVIFSYKTTAHREGKSITSVKYDTKKGLHTVVA
jgi:hypothetical protein